GPNGDSQANSLHSLVISAIPLGATLSERHGHSFTATSGNSSVDVSGWSYTSLTITPANDSNFTLNIAATEQDADGNVSAPTTNTEDRKSDGGGDREAPGGRDGLRRTNPAHSARRHPSERRGASRRL